MKFTLPNPNVEPRPGQPLSDGAVVQALEAIQENFDVLANKFPVSGPDLAVKARRGQTNVVVNSQGGYATINHNAGWLPKVVHVTPVSGAFQINATADSYSKTSFRVGVYRTDGPNVGEITIAWTVEG